MLMGMYKIRCEKRKIREDDSCNNQVLFKKTEKKGKILNLVQGEVFTRNNEEPRNIATTEFLVWRGY